MTAHTPTQDEHSDVVGGSTAARRLGCPGSYLREKLAPADPGSIHALEGTALHELMAAILSDEAAPDDFLPFTYHDERSGKDFTVDVDLWEDKGWPALDAFDGLVDDITNAHDADFEFLIEKRVEFPGIPGAFGTADIVGRCVDDIYIMDWKFGRRTVPAEENKQLMFYALAAINSLPFLHDRKVTDTTTVHMYIIQPTAEHEDDITRRFSCSYGHLCKFADRLRDAVEQAQSKDATIEKGPWCEFARCKPFCELHRGALGDLRDMHEKMLALKETPKDEEGEVDLEMGELLGQMLDLADTAEEWAKAARDQAKAFATDGGHVKGYKLAKGRAPAIAWKAGYDEVVKKMRSRGFKLDQFAPRSLITPTQAKKLFDKNNKEFPEAELTYRGEPTTTRLVREDSSADEAVDARTQMKRLHEGIEALRKG